MSCNNYTATQIPVSVGFDANGNAGSLVETKEIKVTKIETPTDADQLIIAAGTEVVFKGNVTVEGTINVGAVEAASSLSSLTDVTITSVTNNEVLAWDTTTGKWINQTASEAGLVAPGDLSIYATTASLANYATTGSLNNYATTASLTGYLATTSINNTVQAQDSVLDALSLATVTANTIPYFNTGAAATNTPLTNLARTLLDDSTVGAMQQTLELRPGIDVQVQNTSLQNIADINTAFINIDDVIAWDGANWIAQAAPGGGGPIALDQLSDVTAPSPGNNDFLVYDTGTTDWVNKTPAQARTSLGATTVGNNIITVTPPVANTYLRINSNDTVTPRTYAEVRDDLDVVPGENVQAYDAGLQSIANLNLVANTLVYFTATDAAATSPLTEFGRSLLDDANATECRGTLSAQLSSVPLNNITDLCTGVGSTGPSATGRLLYTVENGLFGGINFLPVPLFSDTNIPSNYGKVLKLADPNIGGTPNQRATPSWGSVAQSEITGLTTADTPRFAGLNVANEDTTITRSGPGDIAVENNIVYRQGGTDVAIGDGGTGISTAPNAGEVLVGQLGNTYALQSGATLRTSIGLGTGNSPQFLEVNIGHASDTTITRTAAGVIAVENKRVFALKSGETPAEGDLFYFDGIDFVRLAPPASNVAVLVNYGVGDGNPPEWIEIPNTIGTYTLKSVAGAVQWVEG